jgi:hypothetical protein
MDLKRAWSLCAASRSLRFLIGVSVLLLMSASWNFWHYRLDQERRARAQEAQRASAAAAALAREEAELVESNRRARDAKADARVQELYDEINQLTKLSERILLPDQISGASTSTTTSDRDNAVRIR